LAFDNTSLAQYNHIDWCLDDESGCWQLIKLTSSRLITYHFYITFQNNFNRALKTLITLSYTTQMTKMCDDQCTYESIVIPIKLSLH